MSMLLFILQTVFPNMHHGPCAHLTH